METHLSQGCGYGKAAGCRLVGLLFPESVEVTVIFQAPNNTPLKGSPDHVVTFPADGPLIPDSV